MSKVTLDKNFNIELLKSIPELNTKQINSIIKNVETNFRSNADLVESSENVLSFFTTDTTDASKTYTYKKFMRNYYETAFVYDLLTKNTNATTFILNNFATENNLTTGAELKTWFTETATEEEKEQVYDAVMDADDYDIESNYLQYIKFHDILASQFISENTFSTINPISKAEFTNDTIFSRDTTDVRFSYNVSDAYFSDVTQAYEVNKKILQDIKTHINNLSEMTFTLDPQLEQDLSDQLVNEGFTLGTEGYEIEYENRLADLTEKKRANFADSKILKIKMLSMINNVTKIKSGYKFDVLFTYSVTNNGGKFTTVTEEEKNFSDLIDVNNTIFSTYNTKTTEETTVEKGIEIG